jgi:hypothetical protein
MHKQHTTAINAAAFMAGYVIGSLGGLFTGRLMLPTSTFRACRLQ